MTTPNRAMTMKADTTVPTEGERSPLAKLREFLENHGMKGKTGPRAFSEFERELHARMMETERDVIAAEMVKLDIDADAVEIAGKVHRRVLRQSQTYMTSAGEVVVERTLYKDRSDEEGRCVSPMELALGIVGDFWTPHAAQQALWVATQMTAKKSAELFARVGNMTPSKSTIDRLPKLLAERWEMDRGGRRTRESCAAWLAWPTAPTSADFASSRAPSRRSSSTWQTSPISRSPNRRSWSQGERASMRRPTRSSSARRLWTRHCLPCAKSFGHGPISWS